MQRAPTIRLRGGFTLIELIVVVVLILFLAGMAVRFLPSAASQAREASTAALVQGWINQAKQRALRDQAPRGLRLWNRNSDLRIVECEFVEQPDLYTGDPLITAPFPPLPGSQTPNTVIFEVQPTAPPTLPTPPVEIANGSATPSDWLIQPGDYLSVNGGRMHRILSLTPTPASPAVPTRITAVLNSSFTTPIYPLDQQSSLPKYTRNYYVLRAPRPLGEEALKLPLDDENPQSLRGIIIDLNTNIDAGFTNAATTTPWNSIPSLSTATPYVDLLFNPSGSAQVFVPSGGATGPVAVPSGILNLWVRTVDVARPGDAGPPASYFAGDPTLVSVHLANGFVSAYAPHPGYAALPAPNANNPYFFVQ